MAFTYLNVKSTKCFCLLPVVLRIWSLHHRCVIAFGTTNAINDGNAPNLIHDPLCDQDVCFALVAGIRPTVAAELRRTCN